MTKTVGKRELNKARRRKAIVDVATRSFLNHGYGETTMSGIADALGGSKATLWSHFSSKEDVFAAVIDALVESFSNDIDEVLTGQTFTIESMRRVCHRFLDCLMHPDAVLLFRLIISQSERFPEIKALFFDRGPSKLRRCLCAFLCTRFEEDDAWALTRITVSTINGYRSEILLRPYDTTAEQRRAFVDRFVDSIKWPQPRAGVESCDHLPVRDEDVSTDKIPARKARTDGNNCH